MFQRDYLGHLNDEGYVAIVAHTRIEIYRLISTIIKSLNADDKTIEQIMSQMFIIENADHPFFPTLIMKKTPFSLEEVELMTAGSDVYGVRRIFTPYSDPILETEYDRFKKPKFVKNFGAHVESRARMFHCGVVRVLSLTGED